MRFGRTLEHSIYPPWRENYLDYNKLKKLLREEDSEADTQAEWTDEDESKFVDELVNVQLEKVHAFHKDTYEKLRDRTAKCEARLDIVAMADNAGEEGQRDGVAAAGPHDGGGKEYSGKKPMPSEQEQQKILKDVLAELDHITRETNELEKYSRINYAGFLKAAKKHDRKRGQSYRVRPLLQVRLAALPFNKEDYNPLLYRLSAMYGFVRQHLDGAENRGLGMSELLQAKEEYMSHKFWVHPDNLLELKTRILRHLPVLVYNPQPSKVAEGTQPDPSITSIYFDNSAFKLYTRKVDHGEASSLRLRWYGQLNDKPEIWFEKKTVRQDNTSSESRFSTKGKYVQRLINDEYHLEKQIQKLEDRVGSDSDEVKHLRSSIEEIQRFIKENGLQPVLRANYRRTAFQVPGDDRVRISLDTNLAFIREDALDDRPCRDPETWHRTDIDNNEMEYPFSAIRKGEVSRFPYAILEIKLRNSSKRSEWIEDITNSHLVKEAPRFSKFVHGVALLFEDYVNTFPFWLSDIETDIRRDPRQAFEEEQARKQKEMEDEFAVGSLLKNKSSFSSPRHRGHQGAVMSPVGSPSLAQLYHHPSERPQNGDKNDLAGVGDTKQVQVNENAEEPDDGETGWRALGMEQMTTGGLKSLFPTFSTSKYARARRSRTKLPPGVSKPEYWIKDQGPVKVEAKVWLANQRTFIKWQHVSILLASLSLGLYNAAGRNNTVARTLGIVYTILAAFTAAWGYGIYMWRVRLIERRSGKDFDAISGPLIVCAGLIVALLLNFIFKYNAIIEDRGNAHLRTLLAANGTDLPVGIHSVEL